MKISLFYKKLLRSILLLLLFLLFFSISAYSYSKTITKNLSNNLLRLHIIANSNSESDQQLKLKVRDALLKYMQAISSNCKTKQDIIRVSQKNIESFEKIAKSTIEKEGFAYPIKISIGLSEFPTKQYGDISLPKGIYEAMKVEIGTSSGKNWWCVMFPPLCFVDINTGIVPPESKKTLNENLKNEEFNLISKDDKSDLHFKFKIVEFFNSL